ncbi:MAG: hypothetical protein GX427_13265 [Actinomycetales bacterium]|nr:hypothetical protein [Actinomycetales bacterium]
MNYFRAPHESDTILAISERDVTMAEELVTKTEELAAIFEQAGGDGVRAPEYVDSAKRNRDKARRDRDERRQEQKTKKAELQAALSEICDQAVQDAQVAWGAGEPFFAPVLFQQVVRDRLGFEDALREITTIGWRLDSWQVIGPAPSPFEGRVTLIQTLFIR